MENSNDDNLSDEEQYKILDEYLKSDDFIKISKCKLDLNNKEHKEVYKKMMKHYQLSFKFIFKDTFILLEDCKNKLEDCKNKL